jgi:hypothetical protein
MPASKVTENPKSMKESAGLMGLPSFSDSPETNNSARAEATEEVSEFCKWYFNK